MAERLYEAMFLIDAAKGGSGFADVIRHVVRLLENNDARVERIEKWAERKLSYPVKHVDKGIYLLVYFYGAPSRIQALRRQAALSEEILRVLIVRPEQMAEVKGDLYDTEGQPVKEPPEPQAPSETTEAASELR